MSTINTKLYNEGPVLTIGGGGFSGVSAFAHAVSHLENHVESGNLAPDQTPITINIVDPKKIGPGGPYDHDTDIYSLNQPAYAMSVFEDKPAHFTNWLAHKRDVTDPIEAGDLFASRKEYGAYLSEVYTQNVQKIQEQNLPVHVQEVTGLVNDITFSSGTFGVVTTDETWQSDAVIIADGHQKNGFLGDLRSQKYYFEEATAENVIHGIPNRNGAVLIVGSGQTMMDRLSELDSANYEGDIYLASRRGVMPWEFKPELYRDSNKVSDYKLSHFTPENVKNQNFSELLNLWQREIGNASSVGGGPVHVLASFFSRVGEFPKASESHGFDRIAEYIQAYYGNPTPPHKYALLQNLRNNGQLHQINSAMSIKQIKYNNATGYTVQTQDNDQPTIKVDAIFNSAGCARTLVNPHSGIVRSPLIARLDEKGLVEWSDEKGILSRGEQNAAGLYYAGPYAYDGKWGVETFRTTHQKTAETAVDHAITKFKQRLSL